MNSSNVCLIQLEIDALDELKMAFSSLTISSYDSIKQKLKNDNVHNANLPSDYQEAANSKTVLANYVLTIFHQLI